MGEIGGGGVSEAVYCMGDDAVVVTGVSAGGEIRQVRGR